MSSHLISAHLRALADGARGIESAAGTICDWAEHLAKVFCAGGMVLACGNAEVRQRRST